ncbi:hypothetical protein, partial [Lacticaseibacillus rhamnosus]|uniref:hypothetical protein n=1 Tax=Lacticaseibacillus rhamnosus TaxID=47715 RepID=UPI000CC39F2D
MWTGGLNGQSVGFLGADGTKLVNGVRNTGVRGSLIIKFNAASVIDIHAMFRDDNGAVHDDVIVNTVKSRDLAVPTNVYFLITGTSSPHPSTILMTFNEQYTTAFDYNS